MISNETERSPNAVSEARLEFGLFLGICNIQQVFLIMYSVQSNVLVTTESDHSLVSKGLTW